MILAFKNWQGTNTLAYFAAASVTRNDVSYGVVTRYSGTYLCCWGMLSRLPWSSWSSLRDIIIMLLVGEGSPLWTL